jgi:hypothetical protein
MTIADKLAELYRGLDGRTALPFIGEAYRNPTERDLRVMILGTNSYLSNPDGDHEVAEESWAAWFADGTWPFHRISFLEADLLGRVLAGSSLFPNTLYSSKRPRAHMLATNLLKGYQPAEYVSTSAIPSSVFKANVPVLHAELELLAKGAAFPHVIIALGKVVWGPLWRAFDPDDDATAARYRDLKVEGYHVAGPDSSSVYHHANRLRVSCAGVGQNTLIVLLDHPADRNGREKDAAWLIQQDDFRRLAGLPIARCPDLDPADIPANDAPWETLIRFALGFDGYRWAGSFEECARIAEQRGDTLDEARNALFFTQRAIRHALQSDPLEKGRDKLIASLELVRAKAKG